MIERPAALAALPAAYGPLFDRAAAVSEADDRVRGMWLHGALTARPIAAGGAARLQPPRVADHATRRDPLT